MKPYERTLRPTESVKAGHFPFTSAETVAHDANKMMTLSHAQLDPCPFGMPVKRGRCATGQPSVGLCLRAIIQAGAYGSWDRHTARSDNTGPDEDAETSSSAQSGKQINKIAQERAARNNTSGKKEGKESKCQRIFEKES